MSNQANYTPLSPQSFLRRNARVYPDKTAIIHGDKRFSYREIFKRSCWQSNGLVGLGIEFCRNNLAHFEAPKAVFFENLPRTSTGKVQKFILQERFWSGHDKRVGDNNPGFIIAVIKKTHYTV